jgi:hypothetical protein
VNLLSLFETEAQEKATMNARLGLAAVMEFPWWTSRCECAVRFWKNRARNRANAEAGMIRLMHSG